MKEVRIGRTAQGRPAVQTLREAIRESELPPSRKILVVDDEATVREVVSDTLVRQGHTVDKASTCLEAVLRLFHRRYDCLIVDLMFPEVNGLFFYEQAKRIDSNLAKRTVFITGCHGSHPFVEKAQRASVPVLFKPFDLGDLVGAVDEILQKNGGV